MLRRLARVALLSLLVGCDACYALPELDVVVDDFRVTVRPLPPEAVERVRREFLRRNGSTWHTNSIRQDSITGAVRGAFAGPVRPVLGAPSDAQFAEYAMDFTAKNAELFGLRASDVSRLAWQITHDLDTRSSTKFVTARAAYDSPRSGYESFRELRTVFSVELTLYSDGQVRDVAVNNGLPELPIPTTAPLTKQAVRALITRAPNRVGRDRFIALRDADIRSVKLGIVDDEPRGLDRPWGALVVRMMYLVTLRSGAVYYVHPRTGRLEDPEDGIARM